MKNRYVVILVLFICSCSSVDKKYLKESSLLPPAKAWTGSAVATPARKVKRGPLKLPLSIAVHLLEPAAPEFHWTARERGQMTRWVTKLKREGIVENLYVMSKLVSTGNSLGEIRRAAGLHGADVVLVIKSSGQIDESYNPLALFYLTLIGYYIFPGSSAEAMVLANAVVLDVQSGVPLFTIEAQGKKSSMLPGGWLDVVEITSSARAKTLGVLGVEFQSGLREFAQKLRKENLKKRRQMKSRKKNLKKPKPKLPRVIYR